MTIGGPANVCQPWMNYMNNRKEYLIIGAIICSQYSNLWYLHLIIGNTQKFVLGDKMVSGGRNHVSTATTNLLYLHYTQIIKSDNQIFKTTILKIHPRFVDVNLKVSFKFSEKPVNHNFKSSFNTLCYNITNSSSGKEQRIRQAKDENSSLESECI